MIRTPKVYALGVLALAFLMFLSMPVLAKDITGTVSTVNGDDKEFVMFDEDGNEVTIRLAENGKVTINDKEADLSDLQAGDEVAVVYENQNDRMIASSVRCTRNP